MIQVNKLFLLALFISVAFAGCSKKNYLSRFVTSDAQALISFRDSEGRRLKLHSAGDDTIRLYTVLDKGGIVQAVSASWKVGDSLSYLLLVDSSYRRSILASIDKKYLSRLKNATPEYTSWVDQNVVFGGTTPMRHRTVNSLPGTLGTGDVHVADGQIFASYLSVACSCADGGVDCSLIDPATRQCINRICGWIKCWVQDVRTPGRCRSEASDARAACALVTGE